MDPATERFLDLATAPLAANAELHLAANSELRAQVADATPTALATAANSLALADARPRRKLWRIALYLTTLLISLPVLGHTVWQYLSLTGMRNVFSPGTAAYSIYAAPDPFPRYSKRLTPQQRLLLLGKHNASNDSSRWKPLWDSEPNNPAYLAEYASAYFRDHKELSPEILEAAARIDPDNGWYPATVAAGAVEGGVKKKILSRADREAGKSPEWQLLDPERMQEALAQLHQAAAKPMLTTHQLELLQMRIPLLPPRTDFASQIPPVTYLASITIGTMHLQHLSDAMAAGTFECAKNKDVEGFHRITADWEWLSRQTTRGGLTLVDMLIARTMIESPLASFRDAARDLGLEKEAARFTALDEKARADKKARQEHLAAAIPLVDLVEKRGSLFACLTIPIVPNVVNSPPEITEADLRPGRYAEHAVLARIGAVASLLLLGICAGIAALHRFRHGPLVRPLSARMTRLLHPSDQAWILLGGIVLPLLWHGAIAFLTPLGAREWSIKSTMFVAPAGQFGSLAVTMVILPVVIARWRLARRGGALGFECRWPWLGWVAAAGAVVAVPAFGAIMSQGGQSTPVLVVACGFVGLAVVWLLTGFCRSLFGRSQHALRRATLARVVLPAWCFGMLLLAFSIPLHYADECRWIQQDRLFEISVEAPGFSRYEWQVTQVLRKELLERLDSKGL